MTGSDRSAEKLDGTGQEGGIAAMIARDAETLPDIDDPAFGRMFDRFAGARLVLLGEASHGTSEFYRARAATTRRLIEVHGFNMVAVEADWPDAATIDRHVRHKAARADGEPPFTRFPTWMWRNTEFHGFVRWLRRHNEARAPEARVSFHGLDLYNLNASPRGDRLSRHGRSRRRGNGPAALRLPEAAARGSGGLFSSCFDKAAC